MATLESRLSIHESAIFGNLGGAAVILNQETGQYYELDEVGARMWQLLAESGQIRAAYEALLREYDVSEEQLEHDLLSLAEELAANGLVRIAEAQTA
jgi:hypothetical protein